MKKIFIRSPYFISIAETGQVGSKVELYIWHKGETEPVTPTYTLSKKIPTATQITNIYDISPYIKEHLTIVSPTVVTTPTPEDVNVWAYVKIKTYKETTGYTLLATETVVALDGYTLYTGGYNQSTTDAVVPLVNTSIVQQITAVNTAYINVWIDADAVGVYEWDGVAVVATSDELYKLPLVGGVNDLEIDNVDDFTITAEIICEPKYTPLTCAFINRWGGWQFLTFFKASSNSIDVTQSTYNLMQSSVNYNVSIGQKRVFNEQGTEKIKVNTGWVSEAHFDLIQDLMLSPIVLLGGKPVIVNSKTMDKKTSLKERVINYEIEFSYAYNLLNDMV